MNQQDPDPEDNTIDIPPPSDKPRVMPLPVVALGTTVGARYRLIELLGEGTMARYLSLRTWRSVFGLRSRCSSLDS